jgi:lipopolysaccharide heptosyltransferase II
MYVFRKKRSVCLARVFDLLGSILSYPFGLRKVVLPGEIRKILVIRLDGIGDVIFTTPLYEALKKKYPEAVIFVLTSSQTKDIVETNPYIDKVLVMKNTWFPSMSRIKWNEIFAILRAIRNEGFDIGVDLRGDIRSILLMFLGKVKFRVGYGVTGGEFLLNRIAVYEKDTHEIDKNIKLVNELGCKVVNKKLQLYYSPTDKESLLRFLQEKNISENDTLLAIHMGAGYPSKLWNKGRFFDLIKRLKERGYGRTVLIGNDKASSDNRDDKFDFDCINTIGKLSIRELAVLLERCSVLISCDSGPVHVAAAVGTPCIVLFSGTNNLMQWGSGFNEINRVIHKDVECSPCEMRICPKHSHLCMDNIKVEDVLRELDILFETTSGVTK